MSEELTYQEKKARDKVRVGEKTYYKDDTKDVKKKGVRGFLQRLIPGGDTGKETVAKDGALESSAVDYKNLQTAKNKAGYLSRDVKADRTFEVAKKVVDTLDYKVPESGIMEIMELINRYDQDATGETKFMKEEYEGTKTGDSTDLGIKHDANRSISAPNPDRWEKERFMPDEDYMDAAMLRARLEKLPDLAERAGTTQNSEYQNTDKMVEWMLSQPDWNNMPVNDKERFIQWLRDKGGEFNYGRSIMDYYEEMLNEESGRAGSRDAQYYKNTYSSDAQKTRNELRRQAGMEAKKDWEIR
jgi:hypothetical protein